MARSNFQIPEWIRQEYGEAQAAEMYSMMMDRWELLSFNQKPGLPSYQKQVRFLKAVLDGPEKECWFIAGNRAGKSQAGAAITTAVITGIRPWCIGGTGFEDLTDPPLGRKAWVTSLDFPASRDIVRPKLNHYLPKSWLEGKYRVADQLYPLKHGCEIGLKSADSGREKFQGVSRNIIWLDEEPPEDIYDECMARTIDCAGKLVVTMTPLNGMSWSHDRIWENQDDPDIFVMHANMQDNPFLPRKEIQRVAKKWKDPAVRDARMKGLYTLMKGAHVFDMERVTDLLPLCEKPIREEPYLGAKIFEEPDPDVRYVIGADVGKGQRKGDFSTAVIGDPVHRKIVATVRKRTDAESFGETLFHLGKRYNHALIIPEANDHGIVSILTLRRLGYPFLWKRKTPQRITQGLPHEYGFRTDQVGKPLIVNSIHEAIRENDWHITDRAILDEMTTFIYYEDKIPKKDSHKVVGKCGAMNGKHDDLLIAFGLMLIGCQDASRRPRLAPVDDPWKLYQRSERRRRGRAQLLVDRGYFGA